MASLSPYKGTLGKRLAAHLLRRTTFKFTKQRVDQFASMTAEQAVDALMVVPPLTLPDGPISWITKKPWLADDTNPNFPPNTNENAIKAVVGWLTHEAMEDTSIRHKMVFFLQTMCYITQYGRNKDKRAFMHFRLLQTYALGNLKDLCPKMVRDHQMMYFLNNQSNSRNAPNEDFAREFLELFTILKGPQIGAGNYTNYTESDVQAAAKVFTGWRVDENAKDPDTGLLTSLPRTNLHDSSDKRFSSAFNNLTIRGGSSTAEIERELMDFVDMVFNQMATAEGYIRRLYRFFISDRLSPEVERDIIQPLAQELFNSGYELAPIVRRLFASEHFFDQDDTNATDEIIGGKMRSPVDLALQTFNLLEMDKQVPDPQTDGENHYHYFHRIFLEDAFLHPAGMPVGYPPSVFGWPAFNQEPAYSKIWIDTNMALTRFAFAEMLFLGRRIVEGRKRSDILDSGPAFKLDVAKYVANLVSDPTDASLVVDELILYMFPETPAQARRDAFLSLFLADLSPINWRFEWINYQNTNDDSAVRIPLQRLVEALLKAGEYQTM